MAWTIFSRKFPSQHRAPRQGECRLSRTGCIAFNRADLAEAGLTDYIVCLVDAEAERIGLRCLDESESAADTGFRLRLPAEHESDQGSIVLTAVFKRMGWVDAKKPRFGPFCKCYIRKGGSDGPALLVVKLSDKKQEEAED